MHVDQIYLFLALFQVGLGISLVHEATASFLPVLASPRVVVRVAVANVDFVAVRILTVDVEALLTLRDVQEATRAVAVRSMAAVPETVLASVIVLLLRGRNVLRSSIVVLGLREVAQVGFAALARSALGAKEISLDVDPLTLGINASAFVEATE